MVTGALDPRAAQRMQILRDRQEIGDVVLRFGRAPDLHDGDLYASTLDGPSEVDFFDLTGRPPAVTTPRRWAGFAAACLDPLQVVHRYTNFHIRLDGDVASGVFYHVSRHRKPNRQGQDQYTQYGWYENSFRRTDDGWKITVLKHTFQWCDGNPTLIDAGDPAWRAVADEIFGGPA
jgi:hypothetical protein